MYSSVSHLAVPGWQLGGMGLLFMTIHEGPPYQHGSSILMPQYTTRKFTLCSETEMKTLFIMARSSLARVTNNLLLELTTAQGSGITTNMDAMTCLKAWPNKQGSCESCFWYVTVLWFGKHLGRVAMEQLQRQGSTLMPAKQEMAELCMFPHKNSLLGGRHQWTGWHLGPNVIQFLLKRKTYKYRKTYSVDAIISNTRDNKFTRSIWRSRSHSTVTQQCILHLNSLLSIKNSECAWANVLFKLETLPTSYIAPAHRKARCVAANRNNQEKKNTMTNSALGYSLLILSTYNKNKLKCPRVLPKWR